MKRIDKLAIIFNSFIMLLFITNYVLSNNGIYLGKLSDSNHLFDIMLLIIVILSFIISPVLIIISLYNRMKSNMKYKYIYTFTSIFIYLTIPLFGILYSNEIFISYFRIPIIYSLIYLISIMIFKVKLKKHSV
jgi:hypothetical protein